MDQQMEDRLHRNDINMREEITEPILDAIFDENTILRKEIASGLTFDFYYRTKIARDFLLSEPDCPEHVWEPQTTKLLTIFSRKANALDFFQSEGASRAGDCRTLDSIQHNLHTTAIYWPNSKICWIQSNVRSKRA